MRRAAVALLQAAAVALVATAASSAQALAAPPAVTITSPANGSLSNESTPIITGLGEETSGPVTLRVYRGRVAAGEEVQKASTFVFAGEWEVGLHRLTDGTYTAQATQTNALSETGVSAPVTFTIDTAPPAVTLNQPPSPSEDATPTFTGTASDTTRVTIRIHAGASPEGMIVAEAVAGGTGGAWTSGAAGPPLAVGQYTAVAEQRSSLKGNPTGFSAPVAFTVVPPAPPNPAAAPAPPAASFRWLPTAPHTGETVTLVSTSTDPTSPLTGFAWALAGDGVFGAGEPVVTTSFSAPGAHVVQLRVSDAGGQSSTVSETIPVTTPPPTLMEPFPVVRITGTYDAGAARISLLAVLAPVGATVRITCRGGGCPRSQRATVPVPRGGAGTATVTFRRFERTLRAGAILDVWISGRGQIGKFTRFRIRRGRRPTRLDMCLDPAGTTPIACP
jgi:hypothetical protein